MQAATKHQKHTKLSTPALGQFARQEWAIIGTPCGNIQQLAFGLIERLKPTFALGYVDADHAGADAAAAPISAKDATQAGAKVVYTDKINFHRFDRQEKWDSFQYRTQFYGTDGVLVNGNHFSAQQQIVVIDPKKEASLQKKLDRLTAVQLFLLTAEGQAIPTYLKEAIPHWATIPVLAIDSISDIARFLSDALQQAIAPVAGLVLAGGKSQRMGIDKGSLIYYDQPQREHLADLLQNLSQEVWLSCRPGQEADLDTALSLLPDTFADLGPFGAILSAFRHNPNSAWLVVACDLPLLDKATLAHLIAHRNPSKLATAYLNPETAFPDPLVTIWEPRAYPVLLSFLAQGYSCPRKVLINSDIELLTIPDVSALRNVNTPEEFAAVKGEINRAKSSSLK
ncbi:MAG: NTP transferase domain-containing protein [Saprospiraceae bacterium]